ncbi:MAG TPA: ATPase, T2SS/T4P/T4SS family, partial [Burkholderiaceae bacterium]
MSAPLDTAVLQRARAAAQLSQRTLIDELSALTGQEPRSLMAALAQPFELALFETADMLALAPAFDLLPLSKAMQRHCALLRLPTGALLGVVHDPFDSDLQTWLEAHARGPLEYRLALPADIQAYLSKQEETARAIDNLAPNAEDGKAGGKSATVLSFESVSVAASPAVKLVNSTLYDALKAGASDIHLESTPQGLAVKYRIDGVLDHAASVNGRELAEHVVSRLKVLAELDIAERRVPQDGSFQVEAGGRDIDLRVSIMPSIHGEDAVIRILDQRAMI